MRMNRRDFLKGFGVGVSVLAAQQILPADERSQKKPNVILCMTDDQGWGDTGYNGHPVLKTPNLDQMAKEGIRFDRFYSGAPVCSPTRGSCLTGRHPYRYGIFFANVGHMKQEEVTLAEVLRAQGYATGHFGKWHLGTLTKNVKDGRRGGRQNQHYSPPWENGFDICFSTEQAVPTWDPMKDQPIATRYWTAEGQFATENLEGDDSRVVMDRAIPFIREAVRKGKPFLAVVWFHSPHEEVRGGGKYLEMYKDQPEKKQHYYACLTAMDEQVGRLRNELRAAGIENNTMLWFCSDNGPEHETGPGSAGPFRGRKRSLYEGGVRVPGLLIWPEKVRMQRAVRMPCSTSDYFPTVLDVLGYRLPEAESRPYDGISLLPLLEDKMAERPRPLAFESANQVSLTDNRYKIYSSDGGKTYELYDLLEDPSERADLSSRKPDVVEPMGKTLAVWRSSCKSSLDSQDYR
jgi:arylsulfatase A-like enzyme